MNKFDRPRIAHVNFCPSIGVYKKIAGQAKAAEHAGLNMDFFILTDQKLPSASNLKIIPFNWPKNFFKRKFAQNFLTFNIINKMTDLKVYDRIILRYPTAVDISFKDFINAYNGRFITEHHADVIGELRVLEQGVLNPIRIFLENRNAPKVLSKSCGIIGVTEEIRQIYLEKCVGEKASTTIPNGIDVDSIPFSKFQQLNQLFLNLLFVSTTFYAAHGLDRLLKGLIQYRGHKTINLTLVGKIYRGEELGLLKSINNSKVIIKYHDRLYGEELDVIFSQAHLAVSTLALFRDGLSQASPLKTREYTARGLPFIYAYDDMDLNENLDFCYKIPINTEPVNIEDIVHFSEKKCSQHNVAKTMRDYATEKMDWSHKMKKMYNFAISTM